MMHAVVVLVHLFCLAAAQSITDPQNATVFSLTYGYPLLSWQKTYAPLVEKYGVNTWQHARQLSTPANRTVVKPNVDTIYSQIVYDLSQSDIEITIPDAPAGYYKLFSLYDPYGDNWANVGTGGFYEPGNYLIRPSGTEDASDVGLQVVNATYVGYLTSPTLYGTLLVRWGLNATNADLVHQLQDDCTSTTVPRNDTSAVSGPRLETLIDVYSATSSPAENVMNLLAQFAPPTAPAATLEAAGISNTTYSAPPSVNLTLANATALATTVAEASDRINIDVLNNGWVELSPSLVGVYDTNYALRALVAFTGYLALRTPFAFYPNWANSTKGASNALLTVGPNEAILFTFSGKPPLQPVGFWSLTAYDAGDFFLIPNPIDVYALGDRSNLTYADGSRVYGSAADDDRDGTFQILLQPADVAPPANWTSNWLPAPAGGGGVAAQFRVFGGEQMALDGSYVYPEVTKISAVTGGNGTSSGGGSSSSESGVSTYTGNAAANAPTGIALATMYVILMASTYLY